MNHVSKYFHNNKRIRLRLFLRLSHKYSNPMNTKNCALVQATRAWVSIALFNRYQCVLYICFDCLFISNNEWIKQQARQKERWRRRIEISNELWWWCYSMALITYDVTAQWLSSASKELLTIANTSFMLIRKLFREMSLKWKSEIWNSLLFFSSPRDLYIILYCTQSRILYELGGWSDDGQNRLSNHFLKKTIQIKFIRKKNERIKSFFHSVIEHLLVIIVKDDYILNLS